MPRLRPELLLKNGRLDWDAWFREMGEGACCEGGRCYTASSGRPAQRKAPSPSDRSAGRPPEGEPP